MDDKWGYCDSIDLETDSAMHVILDLLSPAIPCDAAALRLEGCVPGVKRCAFRRLVPCCASCEPLIVQSWWRGA